jgi:hypothetical protein
LLPEAFKAIEETPIPDKEIMNTPITSLFPLRLDSALQPYVGLQKSDNAKSKRLSSSPMLLPVKISTQNSFAKIIASPKTHDSIM